MKWNTWVKCWRIMKRSVHYCTAPWTLWPYQGLMHLPAAYQDECSSQSPLSVTCESAINRSFQELPNVQFSHWRGLDSTTALLHDEMLHSSESQENTSMEKKTIWTAASNLVDSSSHGFGFGNIKVLCSSLWSVDRERYQPQPAMPSSHTSTASNPLSLVTHACHDLAAGFHLSKQVWE